MKSVLETLYHISRRGNINRHPDLQKVFKLKELVGNPDLSYPSVHVAGTNGKGSVSYKIAQVLQANGYNVGLFSSPHLHTYRERFTINNHMISKQQLIEIFHQVLSSAQSIEKEYSPFVFTFFELTTIISMSFFQKNKVDYGIFETGLGGDLDATNTLNPLLSIITSISLEHTQILGNTIESICKKKAGIIKKKTPVVIGPTVPYHIVSSVASPLQSPVFSINGKDIFDFDQENQLIAERSLQVLQNISNGSLKLAPEITKQYLQSLPPCRFQNIQSYINTSFPVIIDVAHNPAAISALVNTLSMMYPNDKERRHVIIGLASDKDWISCLEIISKFSSNIYLVKVKNNIPSLSNPQFHQNPALAGTTFRIVDEEVGGTLSKVFKKCQAQNDLMLICGSFYIITDVYKFFSLPIEEDPKVDFLTFS